MTISIENITAFDGRKFVWRNAETVYTLKVINSVEAEVSWMFHKKYNLRVYSIKKAVEEFCINWRLIPKEKCQACK